MFSIFLKKITKYLLKIIKEVDSIGKNKIHLYIFLCITLLCVFIVGCCFHSQEEACVCYTLTEYEGKLGVFIPTQTAPVYIIDTDFDSLPDSDKVKIKNGITVASEKELHRLMEDFSG